MRNAEIIRKTKETDIYLKLERDGKGTSEVDSGSAFLDAFREQHFETCRR